MKPFNTSDAATDGLKCPECRYPLKKRRVRTPDACEMVCGGCGKQFDICDADTLKELTEKDPS